MRSFEASHCRGRVLAVLLFSITCTSQALADWRIYVSGDVGYSIGKGDVSGSNTFTPFSLTGDDDDVSPLMGAALGVEIPMYDIVPWRMPGKFQLPAWPVRFEVEIVGLREYELRTDGLTPGLPGDDPFHTKVKSWTLLHDIWFDVPLEWLHKPITQAGSLFERRRPRYPKLKKFLEASNLYFGVGIGVARLEISTSEFLVSGSKDDYNFAYQFGTGYGYQLTDFVHMSVGYRYIDPGDATITLRDSGAIDRGRFKIDTEIHEVRFAVRIRLYDVPSPWR